MTPPVALTIAGSDSGGGAGIQADLKAFAALGAHGTSVITAVTAQNTLGVDDVHVLPPAAVEAQLDAVLGDLAVAATKTGMLATSTLVQLVADRAATGALPGLVVGPVLVSATGHRLLEEDALGVYRRSLLPHAVVATPNLLEASVLVGRELRGRDDAVAAAQELAEDGPDIVVVKGGHAGGPRSTDVVVAGGEVHLLDAERIAAPHTHGTGCTFAAAFAAGIAGGMAPMAALRQAKSYVTQAIAGAVDWNLGAGNGPLDHLGFTATGRPPFAGEGWR